MVKGLVLEDRLLGFLGAQGFQVPLKALLGFFWGVGLRGEGLQG